MLLIMSSFVLMQVSSQFHMGSPPAALKASWTGSMAFCTFLVCVAAFCFYLYYSSGATSVEFREIPSLKQVDPATDEAAAAQDDDADLDALLEAAIRENEAVSGSPAAQRLEQEQHMQRETREREEMEQREAREKADAEAKAAENVCGSCGVGQAKQKCGGCVTVRYCGEMCQKAHWPVHKARCRELKAAAAAEAAAAEAEAARRDEEEHEVNPDTERGNCWACGADNPKSTCNQCKMAKYCGVACQTENWPIHKGRCALLKTQKESAEDTKDFCKALAMGQRMPTSLSEEFFEKKLQNASHLGRLADVKRILAAGGTIDWVRPEDGSTNLSLAAQEGHHRVVEFLLLQGASVARRDINGRSPMHIASYVGHHRVCEVLLRHGGSVNDSDDEGGFPLESAVQLGHVEIVKMLLENGAQVDKPVRDGSGTSLNVAAYHGRASLVQILLEAGANPRPRTPNSYPPLVSAVSKGDFPDVVFLLLGAGAQPGEPSTCCDGHRPLDAAFLYRRPASTKLMLQAGADPALMTMAHIVRSNDADAATGVAFLLEAGVSPALADERGFCGLHSAACNNRSVVARILLQAGADPDQQASNGATPMLAAAQSGHADIVALFLEAGAQLNPANGPMTPLGSAAFHGHAHIVGMLLRAGADPMQRANATCKTPMEAVVEGNHPDILALLLEAGASPDEPNAEGITPIMKAASLGNSAVAVARLLLAAGADPFRPVATGVARGATAFHFAYNMIVQHAEIADLFMAHENDRIERGGARR